MKTKKRLISIVSILLSLSIATSIAHADSGMYRMYNPNSGEHFYTASQAEAEYLQKKGWNYEGIGWIAPDTGEKVYRLYNPNAGDHHYTVSSFEKDSLIRMGWQDEGVGWYSAGTLPVFRSYNPNAEAGAHNYTSHQFEAQSLVNVGWHDEGISWYGIDPNAQPHLRNPLDSTERLNTLNRLRSTLRKDVLTAGDGAVRAALSLNADLTNWAQIRADEIAEKSTGQSVHLSHENNKNGMPAWANASLFRSPNYDNKSIAWGPEALYYEFGVDADKGFNNAVNFWWNEYYTAYGNYSHYLVLSSPLANCIGFGVSKAANGAIIVAAEIAYR
ncbi:MAG: CAP domain-containing protein [Streptococcaceae bacterium]|jgi:hypothetical protein|nr:CAP domain-containing protein [Streptococcaceae bacterium]